MKNRTRMFGVSLLILTLVTAAILGLIAGPDSPLTWLLIALLLLLPVLASLAEDAEAPPAYLCIADMATGFEYENGAW